MALGGSAHAKGEAPANGILCRPRQLGEANRVAAIQRHHGRANFADAGKIIAKAGQRHNGINARGMRNPEAVEARLLGKPGRGAGFINGRQRRTTS